MHNKPVQHINNYNNSVFSRTDSKLTISNICFIYLTRVINNLSNIVTGCELIVDTG